jgi:hypothetical protein
MADPIKPPEASNSFKVRALARGFYGCLREVGDVFEITADTDLGGWMDPLEARDRQRNATKLAGYAKDRRKPAPTGTKATPAMRYK